MITQPKDYLDAEDERNYSHTDFYTDLIKRAFGEDLTQIIIAHHMTFVRRGPDGHPIVREIPSADCALFDEEIMRAVCGDDCDTVRKLLAVTPTEQRETALALWLFDRDNKVTPDAQMYARGSEVSAEQRMANLHNEARAANAAARS